MNRIVLSFLILAFCCIGCGGGGSSTANIVDGTDNGTNNDTNNNTDDTQAPTIPVNLRGTPLSASRINLTWDAASDNVAVSGYGIFRDGVQIDTTAALTYTDTGLFAGTACAYQILAYDQAGNQSVLSETVHLTTLLKELALYVDNVTGNESFDGSEASPLATIEQALDLAETNTTIIVKDTGTPYTGVCVNKSGISIIGIDGRPTIDQYVVCDGRNALLYSRADDTLFENFNLDASAYAGESVRALIFSGLPDQTIHRNIATNIHAVGPGFGRAGRSLISSSYCYNCVLEKSSSHNAEEHGIYWTNHQDGSVIRNNVVSKADGACLQLNSDPETFTPGHATRDGIMSNNLVENNIFYDCGDGGGGGGGSAINLAGVEDSIFRNNIVYGTEMTGGIANWDDGYSSWGDSGNYAFGCKNNTFLHNTIDCRSCDRHALSFRNGSINNTFVNNIVLTSDRDAIAVDPESNTGLTIDTNVYLANTLFEDTSENWISFTQWQSSMGYDQNSIQSTMALLFENPGDNGYHLLNTSPARNAGEDRNVESDIAGNSRPQGDKPDIGAREYTE